MKENILLNKRKILLVFTLLFFIISVYSVSAHFVCGIVQDSPDNVSSSWMNVRVFYPSNPLQFTSCQISPQDNKYCCDSEAIPGKTWKIGDVVNAEVYESNLGYFAGPVSVTTTGEGYDLFPNMQIRKAIEIYSPINNLLISNSSDILLNLTLANPFNSISLSNSSGSFILCNNCTNFSSNVSAKFGTNSWNLVANDGTQNFSDSMDFTILKEVDFSRNLQCDKCGESSIPQGQEVNVSLKFNFSSNVSNIELDEFVPVDFEIINTTGVLENYSNTHNVIRWNISGSQGNLEYSVKAPNISFFGNSKVYIFNSELGGELINQDNVTVKNFFNLFPPHEPEEERHIYGVIYSRIDSGNPYVIHNQGDIQNIAFYPNGTLKNVAFNVSEAANNLNGAFKSFSINSNVDSNLLDKIYLDMRLNTSEIPNANNVSVYARNNGWKRQNVSIYKDATGNVYLKGFINGNAFALVSDYSGSTYNQFYVNLINLLRIKPFPFPLFGLNF
jgi:hypothetical protein